MKAARTIVLIVLGTLALPSVLLAGDPAAGKAGWTKESPQSDGSAARSCVSCHGRDLTQPGRQVNTGKVIKPLAPSVNLKRLTDPAKIEKWLRRNCRWTLGRECTATEKADFIAYIKTQ
ncbi:hypothetical protein CKO42_16475 [Lamprobacter modestohalophilus]|uniref:Cytochrome c domain-containing protein n=1 Tax=Lamprobacter modestohalophilus TaxID=1064514 RepID=A0A9X0WAV9_9GAMM|nr:DUF1924 domain-containing protein [Lamprobacter modestohalophilus]MBK1620006.1 hypothetical protein [Lamprobacter modestohalophilus]